MNRITAIAAATLLSLGAVACTEAEEERTEAEAAEAGNDIEAGAESAGNALQEEAAQVGAAIEAGAQEAAQEIDEATDRLEQEAAEQEAETATDARGN